MRSTDSLIDGRRVATGPVPVLSAGRSTQPDRVETISDYRSFIELESVWNRLVDEAAIEHPFCNFEFVRTWWECFGKGHELRIVVAKAGTRVVAIAPLMLGHAWSRGFRLRRLSAIGSEYSRRFDFIVAATAPDGYRVICESILRHASGWDELRLNGLAGPSRTLDELKRRFANLQWRTEVDALPEDGLPCVALNGGADEYFDRLRAALSRIDSAGGLRLEVISADRAVSEAVEDGLRIDPADWGGIAVTASRSQRDAALVFYRLLARRASARGSVSLLFLTAHGRRVAFAYGLRVRHRLYTLKAGHDALFTPSTPEHRRAYAVFRQAFQHGMHEFESAGAMNPWKQEMNERPPSLHRLTLVRNTWRARVAVTLRRRPRTASKPVDLKSAISA